MNELKWIEWKEVKWVKWWIWLGTTLWGSPYGRKRVSLSKWLDLFVVTKSFQNEWNRWEMNEMKWIEWNEVKWVNGWKWLCEPYEKVPMVRRRCPYQNEWNRWEMNELKWNEWIEWFKGFDFEPLQSDLSEPNGNLPMVEWKCPYQSDLMWVKMSVPIKMNGIDEKWMNWSE